VIEDAEKQNKISELYDLVHQSESMIDSKLCKVFTIKVRMNFEFYPFDSN
jgi:hypothetical protein